MQLALKRGGPVRDDPGIQRKGRVEDSDRERQREYERFEKEQKKNKKRKSKFSDEENDSTDFNQRLDKKSLDKLAGPNKGSGKKKKNKLRFGSDEGEDRFDRLKDMDVDSFMTDSDVDRNIEFFERKDVDRILKGKKHLKNYDPFHTDVMSEINDEKEKNVLFNHTLEKGLFNDLRSSPLREKLPDDLQLYNPALEKRLYQRQKAKVPGYGPPIREQQR